MSPAAELYSPVSKGRNKWKWKTGGLSLNITDWVGNEEGVDKKNHFD